MVINLKILQKIFKGMMAVSASVGLPWVIAAFTFDPFTTAAQYLFIIIVGLQVIIIRK